MSENGILITGDTSQGKTCIIDELFMITYGQGIDCFKITAHSGHTKKAYSFVTECMEHLMGLDSNSTHIQREVAVSQALAEYEISSLYFILNSVLGTKFPTPTVPQKIQAKLPDAKRRLFTLLCTKLIPQLKVMKNVTFT